MSDTTHKYLWQVASEAYWAQVDTSIPCAPPEEDHWRAVLRAIADVVAPSDEVEARGYLPAAIECQRIRQHLIGEREWPTPSNAHQMPIKCPSSNRDVA